MVTRTIVIERKQTSWSEDSPQMDTRIINSFILSNPKARIISVLHSGVKHLLIIYEDEAGQDLPPTEKPSNVKAAF